MPEPNKGPWPFFHTSMLINAEGLEFGYGKGEKVLRSIDLCLDKPGLVSILGPNGVGKSTLIHCLNRIIEPTGGAIEIDGRDLGSYSLRDLAKIVGYVPCSTLDAFPMTVLDTVLMGRHPINGGRIGERDFEIAYRALDTLGILDLSMSMFNELSSGQHQKVVLARGLVQESRILLLDEPTSNLDIKYQLNVTRTLLRLSREEGLLILMICHDLNLAAKYSDTILMLKDGEVFASGTPEDVITESNIRTVYGVDSKVIMDQGRPHVILHDPEIPDGL